MKTLFHSELKTLIALSVAVWRIFVLSSDPLSLIEDTTENFLHCQTAAASVNLPIKNNFVDVFIPSLYKWLKSG